MRTFTISAVLVFTLTMNLSAWDNPNCPHLDYPDAFDESDSLMYRGKFAAADESVQAFLTSEAASLDDSVNAYSQLGWIWFMAEEFAISWQYTERAHNLAQTSDDLSLRFLPSVGLGLLAFEFFRYDEAVTTLRNAFEQARSIDDNCSAAKMAYALGHVLQRYEKTDSSRHYLEVALSTAETVADSQTMVMAASVIAVSDGVRGDIIQGRARLGWAELRVEQLDDLTATSEHMVAMSLWETILGRPREARRIIDNLIVKLETAGRLVSLPTLYYHAAMVTAPGGAYLADRAMLHKGYKLGKTGIKRSVAADCAESLAMLAEAEGDLTTASYYLAEAQRLYAEVGDTLALAWTKSIEAAIAMAEERYADALASCDEAVPIVQRLSVGSMDQIAILLTKALAQNKLGQPEQFEVTIETIYTLIEASGLHEQRLYVLLAVAGIHTENGDRSEAIVALREARDLAADLGYGRRVQEIDLWLADIEGT